MKVANGKDEYFLIKVGDEEIDEPTNITEPDQDPSGTKTEPAPGPGKNSTEPDQVVKTDNVKNTNEKKKGKKGEVGTGNDYGVSREFYLFLFLT